VKCSHILLYKGSILHVTILLYTGSVQQSIITKGSCSRAGPILSRVADPGAHGVFLRLGNAQAVERPAGSQQLLWEMLTRTGHCPSNGDHLHAYRRHPQERERSGALTTGRSTSARAWRGSLQGRALGRSRLCDHLHRSRVLILPDAQGRMVALV